MNHKEFSFRFSEYHHKNELPFVYRDLIVKAEEASKNAYAPYSDFYVGAAILLENGHIITGNNQENAAYPSGLCAERVALFYANAQYPTTKIKTIAIFASSKDAATIEPVTPCGGCRQVILESQFRQKEPIELILVGSNKIYIIHDASLLLPLHFSKSFLI